MPLLDDCIGKWFDSPSKSFSLRNFWVSDLYSRNEAIGTTTPLSWVPSSLAWNHRVLFYNPWSLQKIPLWGLDYNSSPLRKGHILGFFYCLVFGDVFTFRVQTDGTGTTGPCAQGRVWWMRSSPASMKQNKTRLKTFITQQCKSQQQG